MNDLSKISSTDHGLERRLPLPFEGVDVNFCRNPQCSGLGLSPDPYKRPLGSPAAPPEAIRGVVAGSRHSEFFTCPTCSTNHRLKNNKAIFEEYNRLKDLQQVDPIAPGCRNPECENLGKSLAAHPDQYRSFGRTAGGDPRHQCKCCKKTFSIGRATRRQKRSDKNPLLYRMMVNGVPFLKMCSIAQVSYHDIYRKIDFIYGQVRAFRAEREVFDGIDWMKVGSRFATDSQSLKMNWPTKRERTQIIVQHLCTAHARSGYIMEAALQFDDKASHDKVEAEMALVGDDLLSKCFREHGRLWSKTEFEDYISKLQKQKRIKEEELYQLPHSGALVRYDIMQFAHALRLRDMIGDAEGKFVFVTDGDAGLKAAFCAAMAGLIKQDRADIALVFFNKKMNNDLRNAAWSAGRSVLAGQTGLSVSQINKLSDEDYAYLVDTEIAASLVGQDLRMGFHWPYHTKSEPDRRIELLTDRPGRDYRATARLLRLATLRSVDSYFNKFRSNLRFAARPQVSETNARKAWDKYYLYKPEIMVKLTEIYRFHHNWVGYDSKETPAMKLGLARGRIYERDFL